MDKFIFLTLLFLLSGCCNLKEKIIFSPENPPVAVEGENYSVKIKAKGVQISRMSVRNHAPYYEVVHLDNGLTLKTFNPESNWTIEIFGVPRKVGTETFTIEGSTTGTQCPGTRFSRTFSITTVGAKDDAHIGNAKITVSMETISSCA